MPSYLRKYAPNTKTLSWYANLVMYDMGVLRTEYLNPQFSPWYSTWFKLHDIKKYKNIKDEGGSFWQNFTVCATQQHIKSESKSFSLFPLFPSQSSPPSMLRFFASNDRRIYWA